uniref:Uncharacterized protein n=1 Tax=Romanomermis culicivorax TaxID=13658 RepID=A0A915KRL3_ROMCU
MRTPAFGTEIGGFGPIGALGSRTIGQK